MEGDAIATTSKVPEQPLENDMEGVGNESGSSNPIEVDAIKYLRDLQGYESVH